MSEEILKDLSRVIEKHKDKVFCTGELNYVDMAKSCKLEIERQNNIINTMLDFIEHEAILRDSYYGEEYYFRDLFPDYYQDLLNIIKGSE